ncbi:MAG: GTP pyrophosphokinase [Bacilli bacterium]|nr:GTP pyrophosphokinase [Bacilli bacterium]
MNNLLNYFTKAELIKVKAMDDMFEKAKIIVTRVFQDKKDKGGNPYINHLYYVSENVETITEKIVGLLHDIIEDTEVTKDDLEEVNFSDEVVEAISIITRNKDKENYEGYIDRIITSNNLIVLHVKKADMENNMDLSRIPSPIDKDYKRNKEKYVPQYRRIISTIEGRK